MIMHTLDPNDVTVVRRFRSLNEQRVNELMESIKVIGLQSPVTVQYFEEYVQSDGTEINGACVLVAGHHRLEAAKRLGLTKLDVVMLGEDEGLQAKLWEIAENLHRSELTALERSKHIAEWVRLTEEKEKGAQVAHPSGGKQPHERGISKAVRELGINRREAQRAIKIDSISSEAEQVAIDTGLDKNQSALLRIASEPNPALQLAEIKRERELAEARKRNRETDKAIALTESEEFAQWLLRRTDAQCLPQIISWLEGTRPKEVIAAMRRASA